MLCFRLVVYIVDEIKSQNVKNDERGNAIVSTLLICLVVCFVEKEEHGV